MIMGIGTDIIGTERIRRLISGNNGEAFLRRVLTESERREAEKKRERDARRFVEYVAGRWAAKEAVSKALGCGIGGAVGFQDIKIDSEQNGKPVCLVAGKALARLGYEAEETALVRIHVSISHADGWVIAYAVAERQEG